MKKFLNKIFAHYKVHRRAQNSPFSKADTFEDIEKLCAEDLFRSFDKWVEFKKFTPGQIERSSKIGAQISKVSISIFDFSFPQQALYRINNHRPKDYDETILSYMGTLATVLGGQVLFENKTRGLLVTVTIPNENPIKLAVKRLEFLKKFMK